MPVSIKKGMITTIATSNGLSRGNLYRAASLRAAKKTINVSGNDHQIFAIILLILSDLRPVSYTHLDVYKRQVIEKARGQNVPVVFFNKEPSRKALDSYDKAYYVGTDSKESGIIQGDLIAKHWAANQGWDLNKDGQIQFVLLKGEPGHPDAEARTTYVIKELNDKGIKTEQLQLDTAMWDRCV